MKDFINGDCMAYMKDYPDNFFDLALCDPPYGDGGGGTADRFGERFDRYNRGGAIRTGGTWAQKYGKKL